MVESDSSDDERCKRTTGSQSSTKDARDEVHSYSLCLLGNLLDFGEDAAASGFVRKVPFQVESPVTHVSCGLDFICVLTANGRLYITSTSNGPDGRQLQTDRLESKLVPRPLPFPVEKKIVRLSCGASHTGFIVENGSLFMFGCSSYGCLGIGGSSGTSDYCHTPVQVRMTWSALQTKVARTQMAVSCGIPVIHPSFKAPAEVSVVSHTAAPETDEGCPQPEDATHDEDEIIFADISCGARHTLVLGTKASSILKSSSSNALSLVAKNSIISFGDGMNGRLGVGSECDEFTGVLVTVFKASQYAKGGLVPKITSISAGVAHSAALSSSGELFTWGNGADGQLGHGSCESEWVPRQVEFFKSLSLESVKCGARHTVAVTRTGAVYTWGRGHEGQLGTGLSDSGQDTSHDQSGAWRLPEKVQLVVDPLAVQQMNIDAQVQAAFTTASALGGGGVGSLGTSSSSSSAAASAAAMQQQLQQDLRVTVRSIAASADGCMALDDHARLFSWGCNRDRQLGVRPRKASVTKYPPVDVSAVRHSPDSLSKPRQVMYMELHEQVNQSASSSSRVAAIRDQVHAVSSSNSGVLRKALVCFDVSDCFSVLVFETEPVRGGGLRRGSGGLGISGGPLIDGELPLGITEPEPERGTSTPFSFSNQSQLRLLAHHQHKQQSERWKLVSGALAREQTSSSNMADIEPKPRPTGSKWHFSLLQELRAEDVPSKESEYYKLMANYKVHLRRPGPALGSPGAVLAIHAKFQSLDECSYDIGGFQALGNSSGDDHFAVSTGRSTSGRRQSTQRIVTSRHASSANNSSTPRALDSADLSVLEDLDLDILTTETTNQSLRSRNTSATSPRGVDSWLHKHSLAKSPQRKALYVFGTAERFQSRGTPNSSNNTKEDEAQSPTRPTGKAATSRVATTRPRSSRGGPQTPLLSPSKRSMRPKSAFGHTLNTTFSFRKFTVAPGTANPVSPGAPPQRPPKSTKRATSASARTRAPASLKLQLYHQQRKQEQELGLAAFGSSVKSRFGFESQARTIDTRTPLHPETSSPLVYPTSPRFSMGSGEDYSLVVARRLARARGGMPGPGTYDRHGG